MLDSIIDLQVAGSAGGVPIPIVRNTLVEMMLADAPLRMWDGRGTLYAGGRYWLGMGDIGSITGLSAPLGTNAPLLELILSGVNPDIAKLARNAQAQVARRKVNVYLQFFEHDRRTPLAEPLQIRGAVMTRALFPEITKDAWTIKVEAETTFARRAKAAYAYLDDTDQKRRYPGDTGARFVANTVNQTVIWPPA